MLFSTTILVAVNSFHVSLFPFVIFTFVWIALQANQLVFVKNLDSTIHWINYYPAEKYLRNQICYSLEKDISNR